MIRTSRRYIAMCGVCAALAIPGAAVAQLAIANRSARPGLLDGVVTDTAMSPVAGATISVMGSGIRVVTGENGRFRISALPPGEYIVLAARIGFEPISERVRLTDADTERVAFAMERSTARLDTVRVRAPQVPARLEEFETRRRNHEATASFNRDDILKVNPVDTWQMLSRVPSVKLVGNGDRQFAISARGDVWDGRGLRPCAMKVMVDGVMMGVRPGESFDLSRLPVPADVHGIEVFAGGASIPLQYGGAGDNKWCGLIAIWTR